MTEAIAPESEANGRIERCASCGLVLPLRRPGPGREGRNWTCTGCGAGYCAVLAERCSAKVVQHVRPAGIRFDKSNLRQPTEAIAKFIRKRLDDRSYEGHERRRAERYCIVAPAVAMPMDEMVQPAGEAFMVVMKDISTSGIALVSTRAVNTKFLALELCAASDENMQLLVHVLRCRIIHRFYEIAGQFLTRMDD